MDGWNGWMEWKWKDIQRKWNGMDGMDALILTEISQDEGKTGVQNKPKLGDLNSLILELCHYPMMNVK